MEKKTSYNPHLGGNLPLSHNIGVYRVSTPRAKKLVVIFSVKDSDLWPLTRLKASEKIKEL